MDSAKVVGAGQSPPVHISTTAEKPNTPPYCDRELCAKVVLVAAAVFAECFLHYGCSFVMSATCSVVVAGITLFSECYFSGPGKRMPWGKDLEGLKNTWGQIGWRSFAGSIFWTYCTFLLHLHGHQLPLLGRLLKVFLNESKSPIDQTVPKPIRESFFMGCVLGPIVVEILLRGFLQDRLEELIDYFQLDQYFEDGGADPSEAASKTEGIHNHNGLGNGQPASGVADSLAEQTSMRQQLGGFFGGLYASLRGYKSLPLEDRSINMILCLWGANGALAQPLIAEKIKTGNLAVSVIRHMGQNMGCWIVYQFLLWKQGAA